MKYFKKLVGEKCYLSPTSVNDSSAWSNWLNISQEEAKRKIEGIHSSMEYYFSIIDSSKEEVIGIVVLEDINQLYQICSLNIVNPVDKNYSNGIIKEVIHLTLDFAFNCLNMHNVSLWIPENETLKIQCYKQSGFQEMARRRQSQIVNGQLFDNIYLDILSNEYTSVFVNKYIEEMNQYTV